jgi:hypothetical protein
MFRGRVRSISVATALALLVWVPAEAAAAGPATATGSPQTGTAAPATGTAAPARANVTLYLPDAFFVNHAAVTVPRRVFHAFGVVRPYVPGQWVRLRAFLGRRLIKTDMLRLKPSPDRRYGRFREPLAVSGTGPVVVTITHAGTRELLRFAARRTLAVLGEQVGFGSTGQFVQLIQQRLAALHFYIPQTGVFDQGTGLALDSYHRLLHWGTSQSLDGRTVSFLLDGFGAFRVRFPDHGQHVEGSLGLQLVALVSGSHVYRIYPISSGKPSTPTILGDFHVYSKVPGYLPDGMYDSNFFTGNYALHGYDPAPDYPASHGCMRLPIVDAPSVFEWLQLGDWVDVYN